MRLFDHPYVAGQSSVELLPLARFLPPLPAGIIDSWLRQQVAPNEWILDPLGANPLLTMEAARAGYRVLLCVNNPINEFIIRIISRAHTRSEFQSALAELASCQRGDERLEIHLKNLYATRCAGCSNLIQAQAFLWRKDEKFPFARVYTCPHCGDTGERDATPEDFARIDAMGGDALHRARALGRISLDKDITRARAEEALDNYLPRSLYFIFVLLNKIEGLSTTEERKDMLRALALSVCDEGNTLWPHPSGRNRPRQLVSPNQFRERNLWDALEDAISQWTILREPVEVVDFPNKPDGGGVSLYSGRLRSFLSESKFVNPQVTIAVIPRPNQAFWTLTALWSGWLWGRESVMRLKSALERRRYDWVWYANAIESLMVPLKRSASGQLRLIALLPELAPGFLSSVLIGTEVAGFELKGLSIRVEQNLAQIEWKRSEKTLPFTNARMEEYCQQAIVDFLRRKNEPSSYILLHAASLERLIETRCLGNPRMQSGEVVSSVQSCIDRIFSAKQSLRRYESQAQNHESGLWWLENHGEITEMPLADRVEMELVRFLDHQSECTLEEIDQHLCGVFQGLMTPSLELIKTILASYGEQRGQGNTWQLKATEKGFARQANLSQVRERLMLLGTRLGYHWQSDDELCWVDDHGQPRYQFHLFASSIISRFVLQPQLVEPCRSILVMPGSRSRLLAYKLDRDPRLAECMAAGWRVLKFRHLARMVKREDLTADLFEALLDQDPPLWEEAVQMSVFDVPVEE